MIFVRLGIVGTRVLACPGDRGRVAVRATAWIMALRPAQIVSGGATGVDQIAEKAAIDLGYSEDAGTLRILRPRVRRFHGPGGYRQRDKDIAHMCTHLIRLSCAKATTYGSGWTADEAERMGRRVAREIICPPVERP